MKSTKKTKMTLQQLAAMKGITTANATTTKEVGCSYDEMHVLPETHGMTSKERELHEKMLFKNEQLNKRLSSLKEKNGIEFEVKEIGSCNYLFATKDGVPYVHCEQVNFFSKEYIVPVGCNDFSDFRNAEEFFESEEIVNVQLEVAVKLWN